ncbi:MAG: PIG-L family deacetylase [Vicinamibacteraceae bacterium]|nr:PIG-L family deacetylase [Vicinamibacteraceae bacterium]
MSAPLRLMAVLAHPDDESLGVGGTLAKYAAEGVDVHLVTATRGEKGRYFDNADRPGNDEVGRVREAELRAAAEVLGVRELTLLGYVDGELDDADAVEAVGRIATHIRRVRPQVVVTFDPFGAYGHPDHIAICQLTTAAVVAAADTSYEVPAGDGGEASSSGGSDEAPGGAEGDAAAREPHAVSKLYYFVLDEARWEVYQTAFKKLVSRVDGKERTAVAWPAWANSASIDTSAQWETVWRAVGCHKTQLAIYESLGDLTPEHHAALWGSQTLYRAFSTVNGGRVMERDLFAGLK